MKKVNLNIVFRNSEIEKKSKVIGIFDEKNNILTYSDDKVDYTLNFSKNIMIRENNEFKMKIDFSKKEVGMMTLFYKQISRQFEIDVFIKELKNSTNMFSIKYIINDTENIEYSVEIIN